MISAPESLIYHTERFCGTIRQNTQARLNEGLACYRSLVRQNLSEILKCTFPLFSREFNAQQQGDLIERFLNEHSAEEPEFHHIATEWLQFIQQQPDIPVGLLALMEYEWVLFSVEISFSQVASPWDLSVGEHSELNNRIIRLNPTLMAIRLPFTLGGDNGYTLSNDESFYAVYRKHNHEICYKPLSPLEQHLIDRIKENHTRTVAELKYEFSDYLQHEVLDNWLLRSTTSELITFI